MRRLIPTLLVLLLPTAMAHEMWLQPRTSLTQPWQIDTVVGQNFKGATGVWIDSNVARAEAITDSGSRPVVGRYGDLPAITLQTTQDLERVVYQTQPELLRYNDPEKFQSFGEHKGYPNLLARHQARGLDGKIIEAYTRYAKLVVGQDQADSLALEWVLSDDRRHAQLHWQGQPLINHQVTWYHEDQQQNLITDGEGRVVLPSVARGWVLLDAVVIQAIEPGALDALPQAQWHSHWASTVFAP